MCTYNHTSQWPTHILSPPTHTLTHPPRYLAELVKFRLASPSSLLLRLKALLDDFSGPHVEAATTLVDNAGRFLLRTPGACTGQGTHRHACCRDCSP